MILSSFLSLPGLSPNGMFTEIPPMAGTQIFPVAMGWNTEMFPVGWNTEMVSVDRNTEMFPVGWNTKNVPCGIGSWNIKMFPVSFK